MLAKAIVVTIFIGILASLGSALVYMLKDRGASPRTARALTVRIGISVALFALLFIFYGLGLIEPHGLRP